MSEKELEEIVMESMRELPPVVENSREEMERILLEAGMSDDEIADLLSGLDLGQ